MIKQYLNLSSLIYWGINLIVALYISYCFTSLLLHDYFPRSSFCLSYFSLVNQLSYLYFTHLTTLINPAFVIIIHMLATFISSFYCGSYLIKYKQNHKTSLASINLFLSNPQTLIFNDEWITMLTKWKGHMLIIGMPEAYELAIKLAYFSRRKLLQVNMLCLNKASFKDELAKNHSQVIYYCLASPSVKINWFNLITQNSKLASIKLLVLISNLTYLGQFKQLDETCGLLSILNKQFYLIARLNQEIFYSKHKVVIMLIGSKHFFYLIEKL